MRAVPALQPVFVPCLEVRSLPGALDPRCRQKPSPDGYEYVGRSPIKPGLTGGVNLCARHWAGLVRCGRGLTAGMAIGTLFIGNALRDVDHDGRTVLPGFVLRVLEGRRAGPVLLFGRHEADPCISGYDEAHEVALQAEIERRRLRDETQGLDPRAHHSRARRTFGGVERAPYDASGRIMLPPMMRRRGRIGDRALFIGAGGNFEVWNPELARNAADGDLRELAEFALSQPSDNEESEVER